MKPTAKLIIASIVLFAIAAALPIVTLVNTYLKRGVIDWLSVVISALFSLAAYRMYTRLKRPTGR
ncbi:hypothetical protein GGR92_004149 [Spirosoma lacussanchae]|uniref:hypothetical protein n=1 Tax=Spirosoma lacussanchae TaxID=1884249 RepID=UPI001109F432|nr:hypothetical protein [Spirosoma lacussanchae]